MTSRPRWKALASDDGTAMGWTDDFDATLAAARQAAPWALEAIWRHLHPLVVGYLRGQAGDDAEDLASEVFIDIAAGVRRFSGGEAAFRSWVFTIAHHRLVDHGRASRRRREKTEVARSRHVEQKLDAETEALNALATGSALARLAALPPDQAEVVLLRVMADLSVDDVARIVGKRPGAVRALQLRAVRRLAREMNPKP